VFPQGILDLGSRYLYARVLRSGDTRYSLGRWYWPTPFGTAWWSSETILSRDIPGFSGIAIDADGSLIATNGEAANNTVVEVWRSRDEGRTWAKTGIHFDAPAGRTLFQCGWEHKSGGAAAVPWHLLCVLGDGSGPETGGWHAASVRVNGAKVPATWGQKPVIWK
jgi:hypothetical protein